MPDINPINDEEKLRQEAASSAPQTPRQPEQPSVEPPQAPDSDAQILSHPEVQQAQQTTIGSAVPAAVSEKLISRLHFIKRMFFVTLIACVGAAALVSVVGILLGDFNSTVWKTIGVIASMGIHVFLILGYTSALFRQEGRTGKSPLSITNVALFSLLIASFIITMLSIWDVISGDMAARSYGAMLIVLVASIHSDVLYNIRKITKALDVVISFNFLFIVLVAAMLVTAIIGAGEGWGLLAKDSFFWRLLGAAGVVDASLTVISAIMLKMWQQTHPELLAQTGGGVINVGPFVVKSLIILVLLVIFWPFVLVILGILWFLIGAVASPFLVF